MSLMNPVSIILIDLLQIKNGKITSLLYFNYKLVVFSPSPYSYFPFGVGHRSCIGRVFAIVSDVLLLLYSRLFQTDIIFIKRLRVEIV